MWLRNGIIGQRREVNMTDDKKKDDWDGKKVSDEEMEDVAGGIQESCANGTFVKKKPGTRKLGDIKGEATDDGIKGGHNKARSSNDPVF
jgi:hypothetical protein